MDEGLCLQKPRTPCQECSRKVCLSESSWRHGPPVLSLSHASVLAHLDFHNVQSLGQTVQQIEERLNFSLDSQLFYRSTEPSLEPLSRACLWCTDPFPCQQMHSELDSYSSAPKATKAETFQQPGWGTRRELKNKTKQNPWITFPYLCVHTYTSHGKRGGPGSFQKSVLCFHHVVQAQERAGPREEALKDTQGVKTKARLTHIVLRHDFHSEPARCLRKWCKHTIPVCSTVWSVPVIILFCPTLGDSEAFTGTLLTVSTSRTSLVLTEGILVLVNVKCHFLFRLQGP